MSAPEPLLNRQRRADFHFVLGLLLAVALIVALILSIHATR